MSGDTGTIEAPRGPAREILLFFLRFLAVSIALYAVYVVAGKFYTRLIALLAGPLLSAFGYELVMEMANKITEDISLNPVVFLSLVVAVGKIPWRTKLGAAVVGSSRILNTIAYCRMKRGLPSGPPAVRGLPDATNEKARPLAAASPQIDRMYGSQSYQR